MWATTAAVALLASFTVVSTFSVEVVVPAEPDFGSQVVLECNYRLDRGEHIQRMTWLKDGKVFMTYRQQPSDEFSFTPNSDLNIDLDASTPKRIILNDVQESASGTYGVRMSIAVDSSGSVNVDTFTHDQDMVVGGAAADTLGTRFGGSSQSRPSGGTIITSSSSSSSSSSGDVGSGSPLGNRFGGNRPAVGDSPPLAAEAAGFQPSLAAATPVNRVPASPVNAAPNPANGLASAQATLQNAVNQLQNALNSALGRRR